MRHLVIASLLFALVGNGAAESATAPIRYINKSIPIYPPNAQRHRAEGLVLVSLLIGENGTVEMARIEKSSGNNELDLAALTAAKKSTFVPTKDGDGRPRKVSIRVPFKFSLQESDQNRKNAYTSYSSYDDFVDIIVPSLTCTEVVQDARRFANENPSAAFHEMKLFRATNDHLKNQLIPQATLSSMQYSDSLIQCTKKTDSKYLDIVNEILQPALLK